MNADDGLRRNIGIARLFMAERETPASKITRSSKRFVLDRRLGDLQQRLKIISAGHPKSGLNVLLYLLG